ncbi:MAG: DUF547 domain-containing protein [Bacteroidota bacterium]
MKISFIFFALFLNYSFSSYAQFEVFNSKADAFLKKYVHDGNVAYKQVSTNMSEVENLYSMIKVMDIKSLNQDQKKAFCMNAYNILVIYQIARNLNNIESTQSFDGFFDKYEFNVGGELVTLNELEIKHLLMTFKDPRVHFALACGARGCPKLASYAFDPGKLEQQLNERAKISLNDSYFIRLQEGQNKVMISKIFKWYEKDFLKESPDVVAYINNFRDNKVPNSYSVGYYEYDWDLNNAN